MNFRLPFRSEPAVDPAPDPDSQLAEATPKGLSGRVLQAAVERALRIQQHIVVPASPDVALIAQQIVHLVGLAGV